MAKISELKEMIVDLRLEVVNLTIPSGNCPFSYYTLDGVKTGCEIGDMGCTECKQYFLDEIKKEIEKEVRKL